jgi:hypothetical protein
VTGNTSSSCATTDPMGETLTSTMIAARINRENIAVSLRIISTILNVLETYGSR